MIDSGGAPLSARTGAAPVHPKTLLERRSRTIASSNTERSTTDIESPGVARAFSHSMCAMVSTAMIT